MLNHFLSEIRSDNHFPGIQSVIRRFALVGVLQRLNVSRAGMEHPIAQNARVMIHLDTLPMRSHALSVAPRPFVTRILFHVISIPHDVSTP